MDCSTPGLLVHHQLPECWWCHPTISSSVIPFSSRLQSFPASGAFQMSQFFASGGQSIGVSVSTSVLPMNIQDKSPLEWTGWISLLSKGLSRVFSNTTVRTEEMRKWVETRDSLYFLQHCQRQALTPGIENCTSFAPILVGFLPDISSFQQLDCSRGSLGSRGNYKSLPALLCRGKFTSFPLSLPTFSVWYPFIIYLFGCIGSYLHHGGFFAPLHRLSSCGILVQYLGHIGLVTSRLVGS